MITIQANDPRIESIDPVTDEAVVRIDGELLLAYGQRTLRGSTEFRIF